MKTALATPLNTQKHPFIRGLDGLLRATCDFPVLELRGFLFYQVGLTLRPHNFASPRVYKHEKARVAEMPKPSKRGFYTGPISERVACPFSQK